MITQDGWFSWMRRVPGPADKVYAEENTAEVLIPHSAVGYYRGWITRLFSTARDADGSYTWYAAASVHVWNPYEGQCIQHYPVTASCWGAGSKLINTRAISVEHEGGAPGNESEPLTETQLRNLVRIAEDLAAWRGVNPADYWERPASGDDQLATLYEHGECVRFGSAPTSCPSGRIPWDELLKRLSGPDEDFDGVGMAIVNKPGTRRNYLLTGDRLIWLPSAAVREDVQLILGQGKPAPIAHPRLETWEWLSKHFNVKEG